MTKFFVPKKSLDKHSFLPKFVFFRNFFWPKDFFGSKIFWDQNLFWVKNFCGYNFFEPIFFQFKEVQAKMSESNSCRLKNQGPWYTYPLGLHRVSLTLVHYFQRYLSFCAEASQFFRLKFSKLSGAFYQVPVNTYQLPSEQ